MYARIRSLYIFNVILLTFMFLNTKNRFSRKDFCKVKFLPFSELLGLSVAFVFAPVELGPGAGSPLHERFNPLLESQVVGLLV